jgi:hypothetical protein
MIIPCPSCKKEIDSHERVCPFCEWELQSASSHPSPKSGGSFFGTFIMLIGIATLGLFIVKPELAGPLKPHVTKTTAQAKKLLAQLQGKKSPKKKPRPKGKIKRRVPKNSKPIVLLDVAEAPPPATAETAGTYIFSGAIFDLITLEPIVGAKVSLSDSATKERSAVTTGDDGRFAFELISNLDGYDLRIRHKRYDRRYAEDWTPSLRTLSIARRRETAGQMRQHKAERVHIFARDDESVSKDFALIPASFR